MAKTPVQFLITAALLLAQLSLVACGNQTAENQSPATSTTQTSSSPASSSSPAAVKTSAQTTQVNVLETEMAIKLSSNTIPAGPVDFVVHNNGTIPHEFVVIKTNLALNQLPTKEGKLDEDSKSLQNVADTGEQKLTSGQTRILHANLTPGDYVAICNVGHHFQRGMKTTITVK